VLKGTGCDYHPGRHAVRMVEIRDGTRHILVGVCIECSENAGVGPYAQCVECDKVFTPGTSPQDTCSRTCQLVDPETI
jgi:hypothetical protein